MDKKEIEHRIKMYELVRECAEENLNDLNLQLSEAEKPKLRHGDYGIGGVCHSHYRLFADKIIYNKYGVKIPARDNESNIWLGNIFDDLKDMSEDLEEFEILGVEVKIRDNGTLSIGNQEIPKPFVLEFCRNLRIVEATARRKAKE